LSRLDFKPSPNEGDFKIIIDMLDTENGSLRHAVSSILCMVASTKEGVDYLLLNSQMVIVDKIIKVMKE